LNRTSWKRCGEVAESKPVGRHRFAGAKCRSTREENRAFGKSEVDWQRQPERRDVRAHARGFLGLYWIGLNEVPVSLDASQPSLPTEKVPRFHDLKSVESNFHQGAEVTPIQRD
jgi:hypothetical protein